MRSENITPFIKLLDKYNECFLNRDETSLRNMYSENGDIIFFDNHSDCDSTTMEDHISKVVSFFGSGNMSEAQYKKPVVYETSDSACVITYYQYDGQDAFSVRATFYFEKENDEWKIRHIHCSEVPVKKAEDEVRIKFDSKTVPTGRE